MNEFASTVGRVTQSVRNALGGARRDRASPQVPHIPDGELVYAIGDIHGRSDLLNAIIQKITDDSAHHLKEDGRLTVVLLGDYVDRGPDSRGVLEFLLRQLPPSWTFLFLKGNHEEALLTFLRDPHFGDVWRDYGGLETLASYGVVPVRRGGEIDWPATAQVFDAVFPREHLSFLSRLSLHETIGDYVFVHAGVRPGIPLKHQSEQDLLWIRDEFLTTARSLPQTVVHGHTPRETVTLGEGRIGVDTGAYLTGKLTAAGLCGSAVWFLST